MFVLRLSPLDSLCAQKPTACARAFFSALGFVPMPLVLLYLDAGHRQFIGVVVHTRQLVANQSHSTSGCGLCSLGSTPGSEDRAQQACCLGTFVRHDGHVRSHSINALQASSLFSALGSFADANVSYTATCATPHKCTSAPLHTSALLRHSTRVRFCARLLWPALLPCYISTTGRIAGRL